MEKSEFYRLVSMLKDEMISRFEDGDPLTPGLFLDYQNNQGERKQFRVINITSSPLNGCFEADCFSNYRSEMIEEITGYPDDDMAITSHRTFKIENIISAEIC